MNSEEIQRHKYQLLRGLRIKLLILYLSVLLNVFSCAKTERWGATENATVSDQAVDVAYIVAAIAAAAAEMDTGKVLQTIQLK